MLVSFLETFCLSILDDVEIENAFENKDARVEKNWFLSHLSSTLGDRGPAATDNTIIFQIQNDAREATKAIRKYRKYLLHFTIFLPDKYSETNLRRLSDVKVLHLYHFSLINSLLISWYTKGFLVYRRLPSVSILY